MLEQYIKLDYNSFLLHPFQFIIHELPTIWRYVVWQTNGGLNRK
jgi:hypothetical protein